MLGNDRYEVNKSVPLCSSVDISPLAVPHTNTEDKDKVCSSHKKLSLNDITLSQQQQGITTHSMTKIINNIIH